jgi:hypothetical protein
MTNLGLSSLSSVQLVGQFGNHLTPLIWLTITAVLMYVGPATVSVIYLLIYDRTRIDRLSKASPLDVEEEKHDQLKAA